MNHDFECPPAHRRNPRRRIVSTLAPLALTSMLLSACGADSAADAPENAAATIQYGPAAAIGGGTARTYVIFDGAVPTEVGVALSERVLDALPADGAPGGMTMPDGHSTFEHLLEMPATNPTPFRHVTLDWNPAGHEPPGIYDRSHFDVHFYTIANEERMAIDPGDPEFMGKATNLPPTEEIPDGFINPGLPPIPFMGVHWMHSASPELAPENPVPFTRTLVYGTWNGRVVFIEPMVTTEFLAGRPSERNPVPVAARYDPPGYYPETYVIEWNGSAREYRIGLAGLEMRN